MLGVSSGGCRLPNIERMQSKIQVPDPFRLFANRRNRRSWTVREVQLERDCRGGLARCDAMRTATYTFDGHVAQSGYTLTSRTDWASETTFNNGLGIPFIWTRLVRSAFRLSGLQITRQPFNFLFQAT